MKPRCYHERNSWIVGSFLMWCWRCGAILQMEPAGSEGGGIKRRTGARWIHPTGPKGENPWKAIA